MQRLQRQQLERRLSASPAPDPILIHPSMAVTYRERVAALIAGLGRSAEMPAAKEALRALADRIVLIPAKESTGVEIELEGILRRCCVLRRGRRRLFKRVGPRTLARRDRKTLILLEN